MNRQRIIVGISGASGSIFGIRLLELLQPSDIEVHLVMTSSAKITLSHETQYRYSDIQALADYYYSDADIGAAIASGSFQTLGMIIAPCSIQSMSSIANGTTSNLLTRAADVVLKERKKLVLMLRETPLHTGHIRNMLAASESGAIIAPPVPAFYIKPTTIKELVNQSVGRVLDLFDVDLNITKRWKESID